MLKIPVTSLPFIFIFFVNLFPQQNITIRHASLPEVGISGTQEMSMQSKITGENYDLYINLPRDYQDTSKIFPAVYLIDAQWDFPLVSAIFGQLYYDGFLPSVVVVGITWSGSNPDYDSLRARDFTPASMNLPRKYGNAPNFLRSIKSEIIPFIENKFRVSKNDRTLMGSSFGGLFTLYTLFTETNLFSRYVLTSPAILFDSSVVYKYENEFSEKKSSLPVKLYMAIGSYEDTAGLQKFVNTIRNRNYKGLQLQTDVIEGMGHSGAKAEGFSRGLKFVFKHPSLKLSPDILKQYTGIYQYDPKNRIRLSIMEDHLTFLTPEDRKFILSANSSDDFYSKGFYGLVHFKKDDSGNVRGFEFEQFTGKKFLPKIK